MNTIQESKYISRLMILTKAKITTLNVITVYKLDLLEIYFSKANSVFEKIQKFFLTFKQNKRIKKAQKTLENIVLLRLAYRSKIFKFQYLVRDLKIALREENYEQAVILRDKINESKITS